MLANKMICRLFSLFFLAILAGCGSSELPQAPRIGVDPTWAPLDFGKLQPFVNGYTEDLLIQIAKKRRIEIVKMTSNWDSLLMGLKDHSYDAILSSFPPYNYNRASFEFSNNFLSVGPVIITQKGQKLENLESLKEKMVGVIFKSDANNLLEQDPSILIRTYPGVREMLEDLNQKKLDAALLERPFAINFINHLYEDSLIISSKPLTDAGLHLVTRKNEIGLIELFNEEIAKLDLKALQKKWNL